jgi:Ras GTPase-activating-like protein IQGAP2/3
MSESKLWSLPIFSWPWLRTDRLVFSLSFRQLKARCLENMLELEKFGRVQRSDNFQDILNAIAQDIRNKHRKRIVRQREIQSMESTILNLDEKHKYLEQQLTAFKSFVDSTKTTIQKKGKRRMVIPFSSQYFHNRELARTGKVPKFGSYKYTAKSLADKGILLSIEGFSPRQYDNISLTISSDEVGVFVVEASMMGMSGGHDPVELSMDELVGIISAIFAPYRN